jgi:hypothetical protein
MLKFTVSIFSWRCRWSSNLFGSLVDQRAVGSGGPYFSSVIVQPIGQHDTQPSWHAEGSLPASQKLASDLYSEAIQPNAILQNCPSLCVYVFLTESL